MNGERERHVARLAELLPVVKLACTACQHIYQPSPADFGSGTTGCPLCGGWTWIAELSASQAGGATTRTDATAIPPKTSAASVSPTTSQ